MHRKKTKDLPEASEGASDGSRAAGFESKGVVPSLCQSRDGNAGLCRSVAFCVHVSCEAARGMSTAPSMNRTAAWFGVKFLLDMLPAQDRAYQAYPFCFRSCFATSGGLKSEVCECVLCVHASTCVVFVSLWTLQRHLILPVWNGGRLTIVCTAPVSKHKNRAANCWRPMAGSRLVAGY